MLKGFGVSIDRNEGSAQNMMQLRGYDYGVYRVVSVATCALGKVRARDGFCIPGVDVASVLLSLFLPQASLPIAVLQALHLRLELGEGRLLLLFGSLCVLVRFGILLLMCHRPVKAFAIALAPGLYER